ncbi:MAG: hypothetical protein RIS88_2356 [Pseudomonadota bacterium]|jgi:uncharacterized membrane protein YfcA
MLWDLLPANFWVLVALAALGSFVYGFAGFGSGLVAIPLALHFHDFKLVLGVFALLDCVSVLRILASNPRHAVPSEVKRLVPACVIGLVVGSWLLTVIPAPPLMLLLGLFVLAYALWSLRFAGALSPLGARWGVPAGFCSGITSSMFGIGGPPYVIYLTRRGLSPDALRSTMAATGLVSIGGRALAFGAAGLLSEPAVWVTSAIALPASLVALSLAERVRPHVSALATRRVIEWLLLVSGLSLAAKAGVFGWGL